MRTAGKFQHRLTLQEPVQTQDLTTGEIVTTWATIGTVWADIQPLTIRAKEALISEKIVATMNTRIVVRWSPLIERLTPAHRCLHQNVIFNIVNIAHIRLERREVEILAVSGANDG